MRGAQHCPQTPYRDDARLSSSCRCWHIVLLFLYVLLRPSTGVSDPIGRCVMSPGKAIKKPQRRMCWSIVPAPRKQGGKTKAGPAIAQSRKITPATRISHKPTDTARTWSTRNSAPTSSAPKIDTIYSAARPALDSRYLDTPASQPCAHAAYLVDVHYSPGPITRRRRWPCTNSFSPEWL